MRQHGCLCTICPKCKTSSRYDSLWRYQGRFRRHLARYGLVDQYCHICASSWSTWHALEQLTGLSWRSVHALAPGKLTAGEVAELVRLRRQYEQRGASDRAPAVRS